MADEGVIYIAIDVMPNQYGDVVGDLTRTGWTITGAEDLDEKRHTFSADAPARAATWLRVYAERKLGNQPLRLGI